MKDCNKDTILQLEKRLKEQYGFSVVIGSEIEFYMKKTPSKSFIKKFEIEEESGENQFEVKILPINNPVLATEKILNLKNQLQKEDQSIDFSAKPEEKPFGSALHIHVNLIDKSGKNIFAKNGPEESTYLLHSIAGLINTLEDLMPLFVSSLDCFKRFVPKVNAPTTISWGANNRTVAIRVPTTDSKTRRIEHRVASACADPYNVISAILIGIIYGLDRKVAPPEKIYGDASDPQYKLSTIKHSEDLELGKYLDRLFNPGN